MFVEREAQSGMVNGVTRWAAQEQLPDDHPEVMAFVTGSPYDGPPIDQERCARLLARMESPRLAAFLAVAESTLPLDRPAMATGLPKEVLGVVLGRATGSVPASIDDRVQLLAELDDATIFGRLPVVLRGQFIDRTAAEVAVAAKPALSPAQVADWLQRPRMTLPIDSAKWMALREWIHADVRARGCCFVSRDAQGSIVAISADPDAEHQADDHPDLQAFRLRQAKVTARDAVQAAVRLKLDDIGSTSTKAELRTAVTPHLQAAKDATTQAEVEAARDAAIAAIEALP